MSFNAAHNSLIINFTWCCSVPPPESYASNNKKEELLLQFSENFQRQFRQLYSDRRPLLLTPLNEYGVPVSDHVIVGLIIVSASLWCAHALEFDVLQFMGVGLTGEGTLICLHKIFVSPQAATNHGYCRGGASEASVAT